MKNFVLFAFSLTALPVSVQKKNKTAGAEGQRKACNRNEMMKKEKPVTDVGELL